MKKTQQLFGIIISLIMLTFTSSAFAQTCEGDFTVDGVDSAGDIVALQDCIIITGNLDIDKSTLTNLVGLENLTTVEGSLFIDNNTSLTSFSGLNNLTSVEGTIFIRRNPVLTSFDGLGNLETVGFRLCIPADR